jgi:hypothetical protein
MLKDKFPIIVLLHRLKDAIGGLNYTVAVTVT